MGKEKMTYEQALELAETSKGEFKVAKAAFKDFLKENKVKTIEEITDEKLAKKAGKLNSAIEAATATKEEAEAMAKSLKPAVERESKYEYPEGLTSDEKKKFRTKMRASAKQAEKKAAKDAEPKPEKKSKKEKADEAEAEVPAEKKKRVKED